MSRASDERERLRHEIERVRATLGCIETALSLGGVIGGEAVHALATNVASIVATISRHDAYVFAAEDETAVARVREMLFTEKRSTER